MIYHNGKFLPDDEPCISVRDRGFLFGEGVFTTIKVVQGEPMYLDAHIHRLQEQCNVLNLPFPKSLPIDQFLQCNDALTGTWRLKIMITMKHVAMLLDPYHIPNGHCRLTVYPTPIVRPVSHLKTLAYLDRLFVENYAKEKRFDDAIVLSPEGYILETAFSNIFWRKEGKLFYPDPSLPYLQGIMLKEVLSKEVNPFPVKATLQDLSQADIYICNALQEVREVDLSIP